MTYIFNVIALLIIAFIFYWFWFGKKIKAVELKDSAIEIRVANGVYTPDAIKVKKDETIILNFYREEENPCASTVIFDAFNISAELPVRQSKAIQITPQKTGEFEFTCQMGMYRGKIIVE